MDLGLYYNCIEHWEPTTEPNMQGNVNADPLFLDADGDDEIIGTEDDNLRPGPGSPCIDAGSNNMVPEDMADRLMTPIHRIPVCRGWILKHRLSIWGRTRGLIKAFEWSRCR